MESEQSFMVFLVNDSSMSQQMQVSTFSVITTCRKW